jgi:predicted glycoside hydrolase/deacetylase ChbG (UPF0249 family)
MVLMSEFRAMKEIIICADDYALDAEISDAIIELAKQKRISAISCITNSSYWPRDSAALNEVSAYTDIGLHFNLTEGIPLAGNLIRGSSTLPSLSNLILRTHGGYLSKKRVIREFKAQYEAFIKQLGFAPHFIDGHQHIHHLPIIRNILIKLYQNGYIQKPCYFRCVDNASVASDSLSTKIKHFIIKKTGAAKFKRQLMRLKIPHNLSFSGIYNFKATQDYNMIFSSFLKQSSDGGLIMCHPGKAIDNSKDTIANCRYQEYLFLSSKEFIHAIEKSSIIISRFKRG